MNAVGGHQPYATLRLPFIIFKRNNNL